MAVTGIDVKRRRTYAGEEAWFGLLEEVGPSRLRRAMIAAGGVTPQVAGNLVWFLEDQVMLERWQTDGTRVRYRRTLAGLDLPKVTRAARTIPG